MLVRRRRARRDARRRDCPPPGRALFALETAPLSFLYRDARFVTISEASARDLAAHRIDRERIAVTYIGVEHGAFAPGERAPEPTLLYLGRLKRYKRIEVVLDVLEAIPEAVLDVAGEGDHRPALEREIAERGLATRVRLHGHVSEEQKLRLLQRSWVNLTASSAEGWCLTVMEAAACGTPSPALAVGGLPESIEDGRTGLLARDPAELAERTRELVRDPELRERLGRQARERASEFTWERTARQTLSVLEAERTRGPARAGLGRVAEGLAGSDTGRAAGLAAAVMGANVLALVFTIVFARILGGSGYGALGALLATFLILTVPGQALQLTVAREVSRAAAAGDPDPAAGVWRWLRRLALALAAVTAVSIGAADLLAGAIGVGDLPWAAAATLPTGCLWLILSVQRGALQGLRRYRLVGVSIVGEAAARLVAALALVGLGLGVTGAFLGTGLSILATALALCVPLAASVPRGGAAGLRLRDLLGHAWAPVAGLALIAVLQNVDVIVVKHQASDGAAGSYAAASVAAKAIIWVAVGLGLYLLPEAARRARGGVDPSPVLVRTLGLIGLVALPMVGFYAVAAEPLLAGVFGEEFTLAAGALPWLGLAMALLACAYLSVQYLLALRRARFLWVLGVAAALEPVLLWDIGSELTSVALAILGLQALVAAAVLSLSLRRRGAEPAVASAT